MSQDRRLELRSTQRLALSPAMKQSIDVLHMSGMELYEYARDLALGNPLLKVQASPRTGHGSSSYPTGSEAHSTENIPTNHESLYAGLLRQVLGLQLNGAVRDCVVFIIEDLDEARFLDISLESLARERGFSMEGYKISRRTVTKYRQKAKIPSYRERHHRSVQSR